MTDIQVIQDHPYFDLQTPNHFINLVPGSVRNQILLIPHELLALSEDSLIIKAYKDATPSDLDYGLRLSFWEEYEDCFKDLKSMNMSKVCKGLCSYRHFIDTIIYDPIRLTFIITEPAISKQRLKYGYHLSLQEMIKIIKRKEEVNIKTGTTDTKLMDIKFKIFEYLDQRLHGSLIQRQEVKSLNVNVEATAEQVGYPTTTEEIDKQLRALELELGKQSLPPARDVSIMENVIKDAGRLLPQDKERFVRSDVTEDNKT